jgi:hypothetical protein
MAVIFPTGMIKDRIQTDAVDRNAVLDRDQCFVANVIEPGVRSIVLGSRLSDEERASIPLSYFGDDVMKGFVSGIITRKRDVRVVNPLIPVVEV